MAGKTYIKTILREIQGNFGRFVAVFAIVALGVGFLSGLTATTPDMRVSLNRYFAKANMMDIFIKGTMGLTGNDLRALKVLPEIDLVLPAYVTDALVETSYDETFAARIYGLPLKRMGEDEFVNRMELLKGRMPETNQECLVQEGGGYFSSVEVGTVLEISGETLNYSELETLEQIYNVTQYTVTGIVKNPFYISTEREPSTIGSGRLETVIYVYESSYALSAYTDFYITLKTPPPGFTKPYQEFVDRIKDKIEILNLERSKIRRDEIDKNINEIIEQEFTEARRKLDEGAAEIAAGEAELAKAEIRLAEGRGIFETRRQDAERELQDTEALLQNGEGEIAAAKETLAKSKARLDAAQSELEIYRAKWYAGFSSKLRDGIRQYEEGRTAYNAGVETVSEKEQELLQGRAAFKVLR